jgi:hypothetical protein
MRSKRSSLRRAHVGRRDDGTLDRWRFSTQVASFELLVLHNTRWTSGRDGESSSTLSWRSYSSALWIGAGTRPNRFPCPPHLTHDPNLPDSGTVNER